jgi:hypothetical protein
MTADADAGPPLFDAAPEQPVASSRFARYIEVYGNAADIMWDVRGGSVLPEGFTGCLSTDRGPFYRNNPNRKGNPAP